MSIIKMISCDGVSFEVDLETASYFGLFKTFLEDLPAGESETYELYTVESELLGKIIKWVTCQIKRKSPTEAQAKPTLEPATKADDAHVEISSWDAEFMRMDLRDLRELYVAARILEIQGLAEIAENAADNLLVNGKTAEEFQPLRNVRKDSSEEEEQQDEA